MKTVRIYGFTHDYGSYAQVTRGCASAFRALGYTDDSLEVVSLEEDQTFEDDEREGLPNADVAILTGPPVSAHRMQRGASHGERFVMVAPNSTKLPDRTMHTVNEVATAVLVPSLWAESIVSQYTNKRIIVVPHGISGHFIPAPPRVSLVATYAQGYFRVLHLSSTGGQRKGTLELVQAFVDAVASHEIPDKSELRLVLTPAAIEVVTEYYGVTSMPKAQRDRIIIMGRLGLQGGAPEVMSEVYSSMHLVCQPSRGEGFGMVPLEALACGAPVLATTCTGHSEWAKTITHGFAAVPTGQLTPIDDMVGARAPSLDVDDVRKTLVQCYENWHAMKLAALSSAFQIRAQWGWDQQLKDFISFVNS